MATGRFWTRSRWTRIQIHFQEKDPDSNPDPRVQFYKTRIQIRGYCGSSIGSGSKTALTCFFALKPCYTPIYSFHYIKLHQFHNLIVELGFAFGGKMWFGGKIVELWFMFWGKFMKLIKFALVKRINRCTTRHRLCN